MSPLRVFVMVASFVTGSCIGCVRPQVQTPAPAPSPTPEPLPFPKPTPEPLCTLCWGPRTMVAGDTPKPCAQHPTRKLAA